MAILAIGNANLDVLSILFSPLPEDKILDWCKSKQIADNILKCI